MGSPMPNPSILEQRSDHARLADAGWAYRTNADAGWVIYRNPATGMWLSKDAALAVLDQNVKRPPVGTGGRQSRRRL